MPDKKHPERPESITKEILDLMDELDALDRDDAAAIFGGYNESTVDGVSPSPTCNHIGPCNCGGEAGYA